MKCALFTAVAGVAIFVGGASVSRADYHNDDNNYNVKNIFDNKNDDKHDDKDHHDAIHDVHDFGNDFFQSDCGDKGDKYDLRDNGRDCAPPPPCPSVPLPAAALVAPLGGMVAGFFGRKFRKQA